MATNSILTPLDITREALDVLTGKLSFISNVNKQYDSRFAEEGAKIGELLNIRMPPRYVVRTGAALSAQNHVERSTPFYISSQIGVDVSFTTRDLTMSLNNFGQKFLEAPMAQLAAHIENAAIGAAYKLVANYVGTTSTQMTYKQFQQAGQSLTENLSPYDSRTHLLNPLSRVEFSDAVKGLFQSSDNIKRQYVEGMVGRTGGFDVFENTYIPSHLTGSLAGSPLTTGANLGVSATTNTWAATTDLGVDGATSTTTLKAGDIITISGVYAVHPETKVNTGVLKKFVVQSDVTLTTAADTYTVTVRPAVIYGVGNSYQNSVLSGPANMDGNTVTRFGVASTSYGQNLAFHEDAFVFGTADLIDVAKYGAWGARATKDGIRMRVAKQYNITDDTVPCRFDILWGFGGLYTDLAVRSFHALA